MSGKQTVAEQLASAQEEIKTLTEANATLTKEKAELETKLSAAEKAKITAEAEAEEAGKRAEAAEDKALNANAQIGELTTANAKQAKDLKKAQATLALSPGHGDIAGGAGEPAPSGDAGGQGDGQGGDEEPKVDHWAEYEKLEGWAKADYYRKNEEQMLKQLPAASKNLPLTKQG